MSATNTLSRLFCRSSRAVVLIALLYPVAAAAQTLPSLSADPEEIDLGDVPVGNHILTEVVIENDGSVRATIDEIVVGGGSASDFFVFTPAGVALEPGATYIIEVHYEGRSEGFVLDSLEVIFSGGHELYVPLFARAVPTVVLEPDELDFGDVPVGQTAVREFTITNVSSGEIEIEAVLAGIPNGISGEFRTDFQEALRLGEGDQLSVAVFFSPDEDGTIESEIHVEYVVWRLETYFYTSMDVRGRGSTTPVISIQPESLEFGDVTAGHVEERTFTVRNDGNEVMEVSIPDPSGNEFSVTGAELIFELSGGRDTTLYAYFRPLAAGSFESAIEVSHNAANASSPLVMPLRGMGVVPEIVELEEVDFGIVTIGRTSSRDVILSHEGRRPLVLGGYEVDGEAADGFFLNAAAFPVEVPSGGSAQIGVRFTPHASGSVEGTVRLLGQDTGLPLYSFAVRGSGAPISVLTDESATPDTPIDVSFEIPPDFQPETGRLFFRPAGRHSYESTEITAMEGAPLSSRVPPSAVTPRGVQFYAVFQDGETEVNAPTGASAASPAFLGVRTEAGMRPGYVLDQGRYRMVSVPVDLDDKDPLSVFEERFGPYNRRDWRLFRWQEGGYREWPGIDADFSPGNAFWLITRDVTTFDVPAAQSVPSQVKVILLAPGWNQVATPFSFPVRWSDVAAETEGVEPPVFFDGTEMVYDIEVLQPWEGYFVYNETGSVTELRIPPIDAEATEPGEEMEPQVAKAKAEDAGQAFWIDIVGREHSRDLQNTQTRIGFTRGSSPQLTYQAPGIGERLDVAVVSDGSRYARKLKPVSNEGDIWNIDAAAFDRDGRPVPGSAISLEIRYSDDFPEDYDVQILNRRTGRPATFADGSFHLEPESERSIYQVSLVVGTSAYIAKTRADLPVNIDRHTLYPNYPNPFRPETTIPFDVADETHVTLEVFDLVGRRINRLVDGLHAEGAYEISWDGQDLNGRPVAGGMYFARFSAGDFIQTRQLIIIR